MREIADEELLRLSKQIRPVAFYMEGKKNNLHYLSLNWATFNLRKDSFTWDLEHSKGELALDLKELILMIMKFTFGSPTLFKPTIAEVLSQIPEKFLERIVAYEIPSQFMDSNNIIDRYTNRKWETIHIAVVRLYRKKL